MEEYFKVRYEFDRDRVDTAIDECLRTGAADYICVADGVVVDNVQRIPGYEQVVNGGLFSICDSGYVPLYIRMIYGRKRGQYCGHELFRHLLEKKKYRMMFLGTSDKVLLPLKENLTRIDPRMADMKYVALPYAEAEDFDYDEIGRRINEERPDIVWVSLGAPKQEKFMSMLKPHLDRGVIISVGAVFKFMSGIGERRAPAWMVACKMEFLYRLMMEPGKQSKRAWSILRGLPSLISAELRRKSQN